MHSSKSASNNRADRAAMEEEKRTGLTADEQQASKARDKRLAKERRRALRTLERSKQGLGYGLLAGGVGAARVTKHKKLSLVHNTRTHSTARFCVIS